jgi:glutaredoxin
MSQNTLFGPYAFLKGTGYSDEKKALETLEVIKSRDLKSQRQIVNLQYNRAKYHKNQTHDMKKAMEIFDSFLKDYDDPFNMKVKFSKKITLPQSEAKRHVSLWTLYGKPNCPFAQKAICAILTRSEDVDCILVDENNTRDKIVDILSKNKFHIPTFKTTPVVYLGKKLIGGCEDVLKYFGIPL